MQDTADVSILYAIVNVAHQVSICLLTLALWLRASPFSVLQEIAETKLPDLNCTDLDAALKIIAGTAKGMGIKVNA